jgi:hypothetical protein
MTFTLAREYYCRLSHYFTVNEAVSETGTVPVSYETLLEYIEGLEDDVDDEL